MKGKGSVLEYCDFFQQPSKWQYFKPFLVFCNHRCPRLDHCNILVGPNCEENLEFATALKKTCEEKQQAIFGRCMGHVNPEVCLAPVTYPLQIIKVLRTEQGEKRAEGPKVQRVKRSYQRVKRSYSTYSMMVDGVFLSRPGTSTSLRKLKNCRPSPRQFGGLGRNMGKVKGGQGVAICSSSFSGT